MEELQLQSITFMLMELRYLLTSEVLDILMQLQVDNLTLFSIQQQIDKEKDHFQMQQ